jgi:hypothetical protein
MTQLKQALALENKANAADGQAALTATPSSFLLAILDIEDAQYVTIQSTAPDSKHNL